MPQNHSKSVGTVFATVLCGIALAVAGPAAGDPAKDRPPAGGPFLGLNVLDLNLAIDTTADIGGETRFVSSRPNLYVGGRLVGYGGGRADRTISLGSYFGFCWGQSTYRLNWETPGVQSYPPLDASLVTVAVPIGMDLNLRVGNVLLVAPYAGGRFHWHRLNIDIDNEDFHGSAFKLAVEAGVKVSVSTGPVRIAGGAGLIHVLNDEIVFEVTDLDFDSRMTGSSPEYFLGVELR